MPDPSEIRDVLLKAARLHGSRYLKVRGCDLEAALTVGDEPASDPPDQRNPKKSASRRKSAPKKPAVPASPPEKPEKPPADEPTPSKD